MRALVAVSKGFSAWGYVHRKAAEALQNAEITHVTGINIPKEQIGGLGSSVNIAAGTFELRTDAKRLVDASDVIIVFWDGDSLSHVVFESRLQQKPMRLFPVEITKVVNKDRGDAHVMYIGRGTAWGNPYYVGKPPENYSREDVIDLFRAHFAQNILTDVRKRNALLSLRGYKLACHCKPLACHGDVLAEYLNAIDPDDPELSSLRPRQRVLAL